MSERRRFIAYVGISLAFVLSLGYVVHDQNRHAEDDRRTRTALTANEKLTNEVCSYEWYNFNRRINLDDVLLGHARRDGDSVMEHRMTHLIATLQSPSCPRPTKGKKDD